MISEKSPESFVCYYGFSFVPCMHFEVKLFLKVHPTLNFFVRQGDIEVHQRRVRTFTKPSSQVPTITFELLLTQQHINTAVLNENDEQLLFPTFPSSSLATCHQPQLDSSILTQVTIVLLGEAGCARNEFFFGWQLLGYVSRAVRPLVSYNNTTRTILRS